MGLVTMRAGLLLRRGWRATLVLALLAGLAAGVAMAALATARRASTSFDRFLAHSAPADLLVNFCPPGLETIDDESLVECFRYDAVDEARRAAALPEVAEAGRVRYVGLTASAVSDPDRTWPANVVVMLDAEPEAIDGVPIIVEGRTPDPAAPDEVSVNEQFAETIGSSVGDELDLTFWAREEMGMTALEGQHFNGPRIRVTVVGVERNIRDLVSRVGTAIAGIEEHRVSAGPALGARLADAGGFGGVAIVATDGDLRAAEEAIDEAFAGRLYNLAPHVGAEETDPIADTIGYEVAGTTLFGVITALAAIVFAGQAVSRQSRREWFDGPTLRALGMSNQDASAAAVVRGAVTGLTAALLAVVSSIALATLGPFGIAGRVEIDAGPLVDWPVLVAGALLVLVMVTAANWWPVARQFGRSAPPRSISTRNGLGAVRAVLPPPAAAGLSVSFRGHGGGNLPIGAAVVGVSLAFAAALGAVALTASFDSFTSESANFGAPWDLSAGAAINAQSGTSDLVDLIRDEPDVEAAAGIVGTDAVIGDQVAWLQAFQPIDGVDARIAPVITGRARSNRDRRDRARRDDHGRPGTVDRRLDHDPAVDIGARRREPRDRRRDDDPQRQLREQPRAGRRRHRRVDRAVRRRVESRSVRDPPRSRRRRVPVPHQAGSSRHSWCQWASAPRRYPQRRAGSMGAVSSRRRGRSARPRLADARAGALGPTRAHPARHSEKPRLPQESGPRHRRLPRQRHCARRRSHRCAARHHRRPLGMAAHRRRARRRQSTSDPNPRAFGDHHHRLRDRQPRRRLPRLAGRYGTSGTRPAR